MVRKKVVFVLGPPGAGKGTQCRKVEKSHGFVHISPGELLRKEKASPNSHHKELIDSCIREGKIVPAEITCKLLQQEMEMSGKHEFLIDGFPRNLENREGWVKVFGERVNVLCVLVITCPVDVCVQRCLNRAPVTGRSDDTVEIFEKRINTFTVETQPIITFYETLNLVKYVDGNQPECEVFEDIRKIFDDLQVNI